MTEPQTTIAAPPARKRSSGLPPERRGDSAPSAKPRKPRQKKEAGDIRVKADGVWVRLPDKAATEYVETAEWLRSTGVGAQHVDVPVVEACEAALSGKMKTLARGSVMRSFEKAQTEEVVQP